MAAGNAELLRLPLLSGTHLDLRVGGETLLTDADFHLLRGELVVLLGQSGTGKTVLLKLLAGILRPGRSGLDVGGELRFEGADLFSTQANGKIGILFQHHALFDELDATGNVRFAQDHARRERTRLDAGELLDHLGVRRDARLRTLSGGQLQRVALARSLALDPELLLYDEPTTGLDAANAAKVAELIRTSHDEGHRTSLVVTHDIATFTPIADRVLFLDPTEAKLVEIEPGEARARLEAASEAPQRAAAAPRTSALPWSPGAFLEGTAATLEAAALAVAHLVPAFPRPRYGLRYLRHAFSLTSSVGAFSYLILAGLILGFVATYFTFEHLPKRSFTEPLFIDDILRALGYLTYRVLAPVLITVLVAARTGAAIASDVGNKVYARQFDALRSFGVRPSRYLLTSVLWALLVSMPILYLCSFLAARAVSLAVFVFTHDDHSYFFWDQNFHRSLRQPDAWWWTGSGWLLLKLELCAFGTAAIAYFQGAREKQSANEVSRAVTRTIIAASLFVLLVHFGMAFFEF